MAFGIDDAVAAVAGIGGKLIDRLWPDPAQAAAAKLELLKMQQTGELAGLAAETDLLKGQLAVNEAEASNGGIFVAGWRPMVGWICASALGFQFIFVPLATWGAALAGRPTSFPALDPGGQLFTLVLGMLGIGTMRTIEKISGASKQEPGH